MGLRRGREDRDGLIVSHLTSINILFRYSGALDSAGSLVAQASSVESSTMDHTAPVSSPRREGRPGASEKLLREWGNRTAAESMWDGVREQTDRTAVVHIFSGHRIEPHGRYTRYDTDGGVSLAGGRPREVRVDNADQRSTSDESTLPPPYSSDFGDSEI